MSRLHIHISVDDMEKNIRFYSALFGNEPSVEKADYVKWDLSEPAVNLPSRNAECGRASTTSASRQTATRNWLSSSHAWNRPALGGEKQRDAACCYARSNKYWTQDPQGIAWETFHSLDTIPTFSDHDAEPADSSCCVPKMPSSGCC